MDFPLKEQFIAYDLKILTIKGILLSKDLINSLSMLIGLMKYNLVCS